MLPSHALVPSFAPHVTTHGGDGGEWDFDQADMGARAGARVEEDKPYLLIGSPMCKACCTWQRLTALRRDPLEVRREYLNAMAHLRFVCQLQQFQTDSGRYFLHGHPAQASSWSGQCLQRVRSRQGVHRIVIDQCQWGCWSSDGGPIKQPSGFVTDSREVFATPQRRWTCKGGCSNNGGTRQHCSDKHAAKRRCALNNGAM